MERDPAPSTDREPVPTATPGPAVPGMGRRVNRLSFVFSVLAFAALVMVPIARSAIEDIDRQYANFGGIACGLLALLFTQLAIATHRRVPWFLKMAVFALPVFVVAGFLANYEFTGFNGEVWPTFRPRGTAVRSRLNSVPPSTDLSAKAIDPSIMPFRFSQYLGNRRDGVVEAPEFSMDWKQKPPKVSWRREIGEGWSGFAIANGLAVTIYQRGEKEVVSAWYLDDGQTAWEHEIPGRHANALGGIGPRSTPTVASTAIGEIVLAQSALGTVVCLDCRTGRPLWSIDLLERAGINQEESEKEIMWGRSGSPLVVDDVAILPFGGSKAKSSKVNSLLAVDVATGKERWLAGDSQVSYASPCRLTIDAREQIVSVNEGNVTGHDIATGTVLWETPWPSKSNGDACASQPMQVDDQKILIGKGYAQGSKLIEVRQKAKASDNGASTWESLDLWTNPRVLKTKFTSAVVYDGKAYALSDGVLECVDPLTGTRIWRGPRYGQGQLLVVNGELLVSAEDGRVASVDRTTGRPVAEMQVLEGITWNTPAVAGPYLLVRNGTEAVCLTSPTE